MTEKEQILTIYLQLLWHLVLFYFGFPFFFHCKQQQIHMNGASMTTLWQRWDVQKNHW